MVESPGNSTVGKLDSWLVHRAAVPRETLFTDGQTVGDWQLLIQLGRGGSGEVWRARNRATGETAAVKFLHRTTPEARARFFRECALIESIHLPGVSRFIAAGEIDGIPFLATEELADYPFPDDDDGVATLLLALIPALAALHRIGIIHRDIKPSNILGRPDADGLLSPVLIDLGLLKHVPPEGQHPAAATLSVVEGHAVGVGTPGYAAPEQFIGGDLSPATDIHALGMLANHCFNGAPPPAWVPIIRRATSTIPTQRFATVLDLAHAIRGRHRLRNALRAVGMTLLLCATGFLTFLLVRTVALRDLHARDHVYVSAVATSPGDGSRHHPFSTIAAGIRAVNPFGTITIGPGVYTEHVVLNTKTVHLEAPAGAEQTVVQGHWGAAAITISDQGAHSTVTGFTFTGGGGCALFGDHLITPPYALECYGGGAFCAAPVQFTRCRFTANGHGDGQDALQRTIAGGGVASFDAPVRLRDCLITNNFAEVIGGGLVASGTNACFVIEGGAVVDNVLGPSSATTSCHVGGLALLNATAFVENATLAGNAGEQTGTPYENAKTALRLVNCSVEGGARANGISGFTADYPSRTDYRP